MFSLNALTKNQITIHTISQSVGGYEVNLSLRAVCLCLENAFVYLPIVCRIVRPLLRNS